MTDVLWTAYMAGLVLSAGWLGKRVDRSGLNAWRNAVVVAVMFVTAVLCPLMWVAVWAARWNRLRHRLRD